MRTTTSDDRIQLRFTQNLALVPILLLFVAFCLLAPSAHATSLSEPIDGTHLHGIDTVVVNIAPGPQASLLADYFTPTDNMPQDVVTQTVEEVFAKKPLTVLSYHKIVDKAEVRKPNVLSLLYTLSAQPETLNGQPVTVASLVLKIEYYMTDKTAGDVRVASTVSYPFIMPENSKLQLSGKIAQGVRFLTAYLPTFLYCAHFKDTKQKGSCIDGTEDMRPWRDKPEPPTTVIHQ